jgi:hypothetical protein
MAPDLLKPTTITSVGGNEWKTERVMLKGFGRAVELLPSGQSTTSTESKTRVRFCRKLHTAATAKAYIADYTSYRRGLEKGRLVASRLDMSVSPG